MALSPFNKDTELVRHRKYERKEELAEAHRNQVVTTLRKDDHHIKQGLAVQMSGRTIATRFLVLKKEAEMYVLSILRLSKEKKYSMHSRVPLRSHSVTHADKKKFGGKGEGFLWIELKTSVYVRKGKLESKSYYFGFQSPEERDEWIHVLSLQFKKDPSPSSSSFPSSNFSPRERERAEEIEVDDEYQLSGSEDEAIEVVSEEHPFFNPYDFVDQNDPVFHTISNPSTTPTRDSTPTPSTPTNRNTPGPGSLFSMQRNSKSHLSSAHSCPVVPSTYEHHASSSYHTLPSPASPPPSPYTPSSGTVSVNFNSPSVAKVAPLPQTAFAVSFPSSSSSSSSRSPPMFPSSSSSSSSSSSTSAALLPNRAAPPLPATASSRKSTGNYLNGIALYRFTGTEKDELTLEPGDRVLITHFSSDQEWWQGRNQRTKQIGLFPRNYVQFS